METKKVHVVIERGTDGTYSAYIKEDAPYGIIGEGNTVDETIKDFNTGYGEMRRCYEEDGKEFPELEFEYVYDLASFLQKYAYAFSLAGLSRIVGVSAGVLSHYLTGYRNPSEKTVKKIETALHHFGNEMQNLRFV